MPPARRGGLAAAAAWLAAGAQYAAGFAVAALFVGMLAGLLHRRGALPDHPAVRPLARAVAYMPGMAPVDVAADPLEARWTAQRIAEHFKLTTVAELRWAYPSAAGPVALARTLTETGAHVVEFPVAWCPPRSTVHPQEAWSKPVVAWSSEEDAPGLHKGFTLAEALHIVATRKATAGVVVTFNDPRAVRPALRLLDIESRHRRIRGPVFVKAELLSAEGLNANGTTRLDRIEERLPESELFRQHVPFFRRIGLPATSYSHATGYVGLTRSVETNATAFVAAVAAALPHAVLMPFFALDVETVCLAYFNQRRGGVWANYQTPSPPPATPPPPPDFQAYLRREEQKMRVEQHAEELWREEIERADRWRETEVKEAHLGTANSLPSDPDAVKKRAERHSKSIVKGEWLGTSNSLPSDTAEEAELKGLGYVTKPVPGSPFEGRDTEALSIRGSAKPVEKRPPNAAEKAAEAARLAEIAAAAESDKVSAAEEEEGGEPAAGWDKRRWRRQLLRSHKKHKLKMPDDPKHTFMGHKLVRRTFRERGYAKHPNLDANHTRAADQLLWGAGWRGSVLWPVPACLLVPSFGDFVEEKLKRTVTLDDGSVQDHGVLVYGEVMEKEAAFLRSHLPPERTYLNLTTEFRALRRDRSSHEKDGYALAKVQV